MSHQQYFFFLENFIQNFAVHEKHTQLIIDLSSLSIILNFIGKMRWLINSYTKYLDSRKQLV